MILKKLKILSDKYSMILWYYVHQSEKEIKSFDFFGNLHIFEILVFEIWFLGSYTTMPKDFI